MRCQHVADTSLTHQAAMTPNPICLDSSRTHHLESGMLDPDGDILVIVPRKLPENLVENPGPSERESTEAELETTEPQEEDALAQDAVIEEALNNGEQQPDASATLEEQWRFKASSKHLALASTYAKAMMAGPWREANEIHSDGLLHWTLSGFDENAISIILSIVHGLNRRVPRAVKLSMLAEIARAVDYLSCHEVMELYASIWVEHLRDVTDSSREDWDSWISIAGVFQNAEIFNRWTRVAIIQKLNLPPSLELPILSQAYGTLLRQMRANSLPSLCPTKPYEGLSVSSVIKTIRGLAVPEWYSKVNGTEEPAPNPFEFWGAPKKSKQQHKKAKTKVKRKSQTSDGWGGYGPVEEVEELEDLMVIEHNCGFDELVATINSLESQIQGLDLGNDLSIRRVE
ncbi:hypothetical protein EKO27_g6978 [Xylaria grammica]|uniref:BTB domain-containing protein n=1 Tax=Xylaria grammica TaxID=363999 RepID=A0A439D170_9PEZI|nr:hypothetical protein EKO27_g6978 [Xylaria grammica]